MTTKKNIYLWLIIAGPTIVVIACIATIYIALKNPNIVIEGYQNDGGNRPANIRSEVKSN
ncbi:MAG: hypothetical protein HOF25_02885 [Nitrosomonadales bacterium]|jgi:hypothetical protein|nr:hypothetical protein [Nitrosomonadales bacterium]MBT4759600.1 hypothetical protein [Nitrosomonadales bacterium]MBT6014789.1 hypothetical protein [Nitrosomonadales bacterium]